MRDPDHPEPEVPGGRAAERLRQFLASRRGEDAPIDPRDPTPWLDDADAEEDDRAEEEDDDRAEEEDDDGAEDPSDDRDVDGA